MDHTMKLFLTLFITILTLGVSYAQPNTNFEASPREVCVGESIQFTDLTTPSGSITSWNWNFGDGNGSTVQNPSHTYSTPGNFKITLVASDGTSSEGEVKNNYITVHPLPNPSFNVNIIEGCSLPGEISIGNVQPSTGVSYEWDFGNGETSTSGSPSDVTYNSTGSFDITLTVTNTTTGCENTIVETINIFDYEVDFSFAPDPVCVDEPVSFTDESQTGTNEWDWDFGDGASSPDQNPPHAYSSDGTFTITLTATNTSNGCSKSESHDINVLPLPNPSFTFSPGSGCAPLDVNFTNTSTGTGTFQWSFGNGDSFSGEDPPTQSYVSDGLYTVTLTETDANGCANSDVQTDAISVAPIEADFQADTTSGCEDLEVQFTDLSISPNADDPITVWEWDFGDGSPLFNGENPPAHLYSEGVYDVTLTVTTDEGCSDVLTLTDYISVGVPPNVNFSVTPFQDCAKSEWDFDNLTTIPVAFDSTELEFQWDFSFEDDGDSGTSSDVHPTYEYPEDTGYFDVQLIVLFRGCPDTLIQDSAVYVDAPIALFNAVDGPLYCNEPVPLNVDFNYDDAIAGKTTDNAEMIWDWGDGSGLETIIPPVLYNDPPNNITHQYANHGTYDIKQVIHNYTTGCSDTFDVTIHISETIAQFNYSNDSTCVDDQVSFTNNGSSSTHPITSYSYNFNDGSTPISGQNADHIYTNSGTYDIEFTVVNDVGCSDTEVLNNFEALTLPQAVITPSDNAGCSGLTVTFSTNNSGNPSNVSLSSFDWTFEDGTQTTTSVGETTDYTFTGEGTFSTSLVAIDEFGCKSPVQTVQTDITKPTASFDIPAVVCNLQEFTATNTTVENVSSEWFLNSNSVSTDDDFTTSLNHEGSETELSFTDEIELVVTDVNGCTDELTQDIIVSTPYADFDYAFSGANTNEDGDFVCPPVFADLTDASDSYGTVTTWNWDFGDGSNSILQNPSNTYVFAGTYTSSLIITDDVGCSDTVVYEDYLTIGGPSGELDWTSVGSLCEPEITFTPSELDGVSDIIWAFGNGDTLNSLEEFNYSYEGTGTFFPSATLINEDGCNIPYFLDPITIEINTLEAFFQVNPLTVNWNEPVFISDQSSGGFGEIVDWEWSTPSEQFNNDGGSFEYLFNESGEVVVNLIVTDSAGCQDTYQVTVTVTDILTIPNVLTPNGDDSNDVLRLIDNVYKSYTVTILNRWGNVVQESFVEDDNYMWDGLNRDKQLCTEGVYFYKISGTQRDGEPRQEHGFVHLITP